MRRETPQIVDWIAAPAVAASSDLPLKPVDVPHYIGVRSLKAGERYTAVLTNWGPAAQVALRFPRTAINIISGATVRSGEPFTLPAGETAVILTA